MGVVDVLIGTKLGHEECVDMSLSERGGNVGNDRRYVEVLSLSKLALVTCAGIPADIFVKIGPPEAKEEVTGGRIDSFVTETIVRASNEAEAVWGFGD